MALPCLFAAETSGYWVLLCTLWRQKYFLKHCYIFQGSSTKSVIQNPSSTRCFKSDIKWKSMPWTWAGQGHKLLLPLPPIWVPLNRCLTFLFHQFPPAMFQFSSYPAFLVLQISFMQHNKRVYLGLMRKILKIHYQTLFSISLLSVIQMSYFNQEIIMPFICTTSITGPLLCCIFYRRMPTIALIYKQWMLYEI